MNSLQLQRGWCYLDRSFTVDRLRQGKDICVPSGFHVASGVLVAYYATTGGENFYPDTSLMARTSSDGRHGVSHITSLADFSSKVRSGLIVVACC